MRQQKKVNLFKVFHKEDSDFHELNSWNKSLQNQTVRYMRVYFDLYSEEDYLHENSLVDKRVW